MAGYILNSQEGATKVLEKNHKEIPARPRAKTGMKAGEGWINSCHKYSNSILLTGVYSI